MDAEFLLRLKIQLFIAVDQIILKHNETVFFESWAYPQFNFTYPNVVFNNFKITCAIVEPHDVSQSHGLNANSIFNATVYI